MRPARVCHSVVRFSKPTAGDCRPHDLQSPAPLGYPGNSGRSCWFNGLHSLCGHGNPVLERLGCEYWIISFISFCTSYLGLWSRAPRNWEGHSSPSWQFVVGARVRTAVGLGDGHCSWTREQTHAGISCPCTKKKYSKTPACLAKDEGEPGSSWEQEEEAELEIITWCLSLSELWDMRKDFSHHPGEHIITWLLRCWDNGARSLELEGREVQAAGIPF